MTKKDYRKLIVRANEELPRPEWDHKAVSKVLRELYDTHFSNEKDRILYSLLLRYKSKLGWRLKWKLKRLNKQGKLEAKKLFRSSLFCNRNPFLELLPKSDGSAGKYIPAPLIYHGTNEGEEQDE